MWYVKSFSSSVTMPSVSWLLFTNFWPWDCQRDWLVLWMECLCTPQIRMLKSRPSVCLGDRTFGSRFSHEGGTLVNRVSHIIKETPETASEYEVYYCWLCLKMKLPSFLSKGHRNIIEGNNSVTIRHSHFIHRCSTFCRKMKFWYRQNRKNT